jgi:hypothetical protein
MSLRMSANRGRPPHVWMASLYLLPLMFRITRARRSMKSFTQAFHSRGVAGSNGSMLSSPKSGVGMTRIRSGAVM